MEKNPDCCFPGNEGSHYAGTEMAWTDDNPGRRFLGCGNYKIHNCGFFHWVDCKMIPKERLYDFDRKLKEVQLEKESLKKTIIELEKKNEELEKIRVKFDKKNSVSNVNAVMPK